MIPLLSDLREPPVAGRFYMVPTIERDGQDWPVIGPRHEDTAELNFPFLHYHIDARFLSAIQRCYLLAGLVFLPSGQLGTADLDYRVNNFVLTGRTVPNPNAVRGHRQTEPPSSVPTMKRRRCSRSTFTFSAMGTESLARRLGRKPFSTWKQPAAPTRLPDGRIICPHKGVDLSQFPPDKHGVVVCPLHGLRVQCVALRAQAVQTTVQEEMVL